MSRDRRKNIFVIGMDEANLRTLEAVPDADDHRLHPLLSVKELQEDSNTVEELMARARAVLDAHDGDIDAIVGYWDFPVSTLVPLLSKERHDQYQPGIRRQV